MSEHWHISFDGILCESIVYSEPVSPEQRLRLARYALKRYGDGVQLTAHYSDSL